MQDSRNDIKNVSESDRSLVTNILSGNSENYTYNVEFNDGSTATIRANDRDDLGEIISRGDYEKD